MAIRPAVVIPAVIATFALVGMFAGEAQAAPPPTPLRSWSPGATAKFKTAAVCADSRDVYVVAAVFRIDGFFDYDAVYHMRIQGNSAAANYGELISAPTLISSELRVDWIDCAASGGGNIFVAYDRYGENAAWYRLDNTAINGPFEIAETCELGHTHHPRVATNASRVFLAYDGINYDTEDQSCGVCFFQFTSAGNPVAGSWDEFWPDGVNHTDYDVEWNGADRFVVALPWLPDWHTNTFLSTLLYDTAGNRTSEPLIQTFTPTSNPAAPSRVKLVRSANSHNPANAMFIQTNTASYWTTSAGVGVGSEIAYTFGTPYAACEYWGADNAVGTVFRPYMTTTYVGTFPNGYFVFGWKEQRAHFGLTSAAAYETSLLNTNYVPEACEAANTYTDGEVMVVSRTPTADASVYWNLQPSD